MSATVPCCDDPRLMPELNKKTADAPLKHRPFVSILVYFLGAVVVVVPLGLAAPLVAVLAVQDSVLVPFMAALHCSIVSKLQLSAPESPPLRQNFPFC